MRVFRDYSMADGILSYYSYLRWYTRTRKDGDDEEEKQRNTYLRINIKPSEE